MLPTFPYVDPSYTLAQDFGRRFSRLLSELDVGWEPWGVSGDDTTFAPAGFFDARQNSLELRDTGKTLMLEMDVPGVTDDGVQLSLTQDVLTVNIERKVDVPEGYSVHRRERRNWKVTRSLTLPARVEAEKVQATLKNGVLTVTMEKVPEVQPRSIAVKSG